MLQLHVRTLYFACCLSVPTSFSASSGLHLKIAPRRGKARLSEHENEEGQRRLPVCVCEAHDLKGGSGGMLPQEISVF